MGGMYFTDRQILEMLNEGWAQSNRGRHALAADAFRRAGQALEDQGLNALATRAWAALDAELTLCGHLSRIGTMTP